MNGNQITISVNSDDFDQLRKIARTRGQTVSDYITCLVSSNLVKSGHSAEVANIAAADVSEPITLREARARLR